MRIEISKEWCERAAAAEEGACVSAGHLAKGCETCATLEKGWERHCIECMGAEQHLPCGTPIETR